MQNEIQPGCLVFFTDPKSCYGSNDFHDDEREQGCINNCTDDTNHLHAHLRSHRHAFIVALAAKGAQPR